MSGPRVPAVRRIAIWEAHDRRCVYCDEPIPFRELELDHILPVHLTNSPAQFAALLVDYNLPVDFDITDFGNLLPAHGRCNTRKSGAVFRKSTALFFLEIAAGKKNRASREEERSLVCSRRDRALAALDLALRRGELSLSEVQTVLAKTEAGADTFEVIHEIQFSDRVVQGLLSQRGVGDLLDEPVLPRPHGLEVLRMVKGTGTGAVCREVRTCREWANAVREDYWPRTTYDVKEQAFFQRAYALVRAMLEAQPADRSFIRDPEFGIGHLDLLPVVILPWIARDTEKELLAMAQAGLTIRDLVDSNRVVIEERSRHFLSLTFDGMGASYWEILRADLNRDGIEDILIDTYCCALGGSLGFGSIAVLARLANDAVFRLLPGVQFHPTDSASDPR